MRILFICRSKSGFDQNISPIVKNQGDSLVKIGHHVDYYLIENGFLGYLKLIVGLRKYIKSNTFDVIHSHYSITSIFTSLAIVNRKIVVSLMGSDTERKGLILYLINLFSRLFWDRVIVKTERMKERFKSKSIIVLPNGVDFDRFFVVPKLEAQKKVGFSSDVINILFLADSKRKEKNVELAREAVKLLNNPSIVLHEIYPVPHDLVPYYLNAAEILVLPSLYEGSVNIVKEGMACCIPIVATNVGDVKQNILSTDGCFIAKAEPVDFSEKIGLALKFASKTNGRENIEHLRDKAIAERLVNIYNSIKD
ncbi:MAG: glycosyltransferase [Bacteroidales bacterium]|nr:MAG: glycosyltransferase [Bacteroidales bacterium]